MIRQGKVHAICCTGANLEEDVFNLVAHDHYERVPNYRDLTPGRRAGAARPAPEPRDRHVHSRGRGDAPHRERRARRLDRRRQGAASATSRTSSSTASCARGALKQYYQIDPKDSWLLAAAEKNLPIFVPGWEDSTLGNIFAAHCIAGDIKTVHTVRTGIEYMIALADWYQRDEPRTRSIGFFQIGGGIAGDFPICVVPMLHQDLRRTDVPLWGYFCQISDSTTSYGVVLRRGAEREDHVGQARRRTRRSSSSSPTRRSSRR